MPRRVAAPKKPNKNAEPTNPKANRFDARESIRCGRTVQEASARKSALCGFFLHLAAAGQCAPERDLVRVLEVAADRQPAREARHTHAAAEPVGEVGGGR